MIGMPCSPTCKAGNCPCAHVGQHRTNIGGTDPYQGRREDSGEYYTYIHDPDNNMIELVYHPLGLEDSRGTKSKSRMIPRECAGLSSLISSPLPIAAVRYF